MRARSGAGGHCALLTPSPLFPVNLWKIYKAVEKLGAYELVSGWGAPTGAVRGFGQGLTRPHCR